MSLDRVPGASESSSILQGAFLPFGGGEKEVEWYFDRLMSDAVDDQFSKASLVVSINHNINSWFGKTAVNKRFGPMQCSLPCLRCITKYIAIVMERMHPLRRSMKRAVPEWIAHTGSTWHASNRGIRPNVSCDHSARNSAKLPDDCSYRNVKSYPFGSSREIEKAVTVGG
jgi:hypothetical protein